MRRDGSRRRTAVPNTRITLFMFVGTFGETGGSRSLVNYILILSAVALVTRTLAFFGTLVLLCEVLVQSFESVFGTTTNAASGLPLEEPTDEI